MNKPEKSYKGLSPIEREINGDYQRDVETLVRREVIYCVSSLVSHLIDISMDDNSELVPVCWRDDYEEPATWFIENDMPYKDCVDYVECLGVAKVQEFHDITYLRSLVLSDAATDWQDFCDAKSIEPYQIEAYEHWIVSDWFADKLETKGEMVLRDFHGLTIWGRTTTGQAIHMDSVICNIYNELNAGDI